jgi:hypothetical protein
MKKLANELYVVQMVIGSEEKHTIHSMILASGKTESSWLREMCGLDPKRRGAPVGNNNRRGKKGKRKPPKKPMFAVS